MQIQSFTFAMYCMYVCVCMYRYVYVARILYIFAVLVYTVCVHVPLRNRVQ